MRIPYLYFIILILMTLSCQQKSQKQDSENNKKKINSPTNKVPYQLFFLEEDLEKKEVWNLVLFNNSKEIISTGERYEVYKKINDYWELVLPYNIINNDTIPVITHDIIYYKNPQDSLLLPIFKKFYKDYFPGKFKVEKGFTIVEKHENEFQNLKKDTLSFEFEIK